MRAAESGETIEETQEEEISGEQLHIDLLPAVYDIVRRFITVTVTSKHYSLPLHYTYKLLTLATFQTILSLITRIGE